MLLLLLALVVMFIFIVYKPMYDAHATIKTAQIHYNDTLAERIDYMENVLRRRRYVPLHSLPSINFETDLGTLEDGELKCFSTPVFVSAEETPNFDCAALCEDASASYFFVGEYDKFVINGQMLAPGGYCTTSSVPRDCNRETSVIVHSINQWSCIAEDPRYFAGPRNMVQVAGRQHATRIAAGQIERNVLFDRLLGAPVDVARNTFRRDWDEQMPDGSGRRFEMRCDALDDRFNRMFLNPLNPIECLPNVCTNVHYVHSSVRPNFETGECECGDPNITRVRHVDPDDRSSICASIIDGFDRNRMSHTFRVDCTNLDMLVSQYSRRRLLCPGELFSQNTDNAYTFTVPGSFPFSGNGLDEPTYRLYMDTRDRVNYTTTRFIPTNTVIESN